MSVPDNYRINAQDVDKGWKVLAKHFVPGDEPEPTREEIRVAEILLRAGDMQSEAGQWPTYGEVVSKMREENEAYWLRHFGRLPPS